MEQVGNIMQQAAGFNRTFMELKYDNTVFLCIKGEF